MVRRAAGPWGKVPPRPWRFPGAIAGQVSQVPPARGELLADCGVHGGLQLRDEAGAGELADLFVAEVSKQIIGGDGGSPRDLLDDGGAAGASTVCL